MRRARVPSVATTCSASTASPSRCAGCAIAARSARRSRTRAALESLAASTLVDLLVEHALEDDGLARKLLLLAARAADGATPSVARLRGLIDQAFATHSFVPYREVYGYVRGIDETVDAVEELLSAGEPDAVIELAEHALAAAERTLEHVDDSNGMMREVINVSRSFTSPPAAAVPLPDRARRAPAAPQLSGGWDIFNRAAIRYADVLAGPRPGAVPRARGGREAGVPRLGPGDDTRGRYGVRFRITHVIEALAAPMPRHAPARKQPRRKGRGCSATSITRRDPRASTRNAHYGRASSNMSICRHFLLLDIVRPAA